MRKDVITRRGKAATGAPVAVLVAALGLGCNSPSSSPVSPTATPLPPSPPPGTLIRYNVSGIVTDDTGSPIANAQLSLYYENSFRTVQTSTDARGSYSIVFESAATSYDGNANVAGAIFYVGGGDYENNYVQAVPWGTAHVVKNLYLRRVRNLNAGQSIVFSIDADSSLAYDGEDWLRMDSVWEKFHIRVADAGTLTIAARPASGDIVPRIAVWCVYVVDNCGNTWVDTPPGTAARHVNANSLFEIRLAIPSRMAPQRYEVSTSLR